MPAYFDMHCHLDFAPNALDAARELEALGAGAFAVSVKQGTGFCSNSGRNSSFPASQLEQKPVPCSTSMVRWGVGLHPWWVADGRAGEAELEAVLAAIPSTIYVGEVGLDFGRKHDGGSAGRARQVHAFERIAAACAEVGGRVLSLHAAASAPEVFEILTRTGAIENCRCIFHWYSGDGDTFHAAVQAGCYFSVNNFMLETKRGREYARQIPAGQLLLETDMPPEGETYHVAAMQTQLAQTCAAIAQLRGVDAAALAESIAETSRALLS